MDLMRDNWTKYRIPMERIQHRAETIFETQEPGTVSFYKASIMKIIDGDATACYQASDMNHLLDALNAAGSDYYNLMFLGSNS